MLFTNSDLNKQTQAIEIKISSTTKSYHSETCFYNILRIDLNEKLNFYLHVLVMNAEMYVGTYIFLLTPKFPMTDLDQ